MLLFNGVDKLRYVTVAAALVLTGVASGQMGFFINMQSYVVYDGWVEGACSQPNEVPVVAQLGAAPSFGTEEWFFEDFLEASEFCVPTGMVASAEASGEHFTLVSEGALGDGFKVEHDGLATGDGENGYCCFSNSDNDSSNEAYASLDSPSDVYVTMSLEFVAVSDSPTSPSCSISMTFSSDNKSATLNGSYEYDQQAGEYAPLITGSVTDHVTGQAQSFSSTDKSYSISFTDPVVSAVYARIDGDVGLYGDNATSFVTGKVRAY